MAILNVPIQIRTDSEQNWNSSILILKDGEPALCKKNDGTSELKFGDGQKTYKELPVFGKSWSKEQGNTDLLVILTSIENNQADATYEEILSVITNKHNVAVLYNKDIYQLSKKDSNNISFICTKNSGRAILTLSSANTWTNSFENWSAEDISFKIGEDQLASNVQEEIDKLKKNPGATPTIAVGTVTTLDPGQDATAEITGETPNLVLNLGIPEGEPGQDGVQINDSAINTTEAWSSKKIVDTLCPSFSVSGNPVTCNPVEDYPLGAVVTLEPKQAGSGDPSPENVRPISGWENVRVETCGLNLLKLPYYTASGPSEAYNGIDAQIDGDGRISIHGTTAENGYNFVFQHFTKFFLPSGTYYIDMFGAELPPKAAILVYNPTLGILADLNKKTFTLHEGIGLSVYINTAGNGVEFSVDKLGVVLCVQSAPTVFTPYQPGTTATLTLPETIYGGTVDAVTGEGRNLYIFKELAIADMNNTEDYPGWKNQDWVAQAIPGEIADRTLAELGCEGVINITTTMGFRFNPINDLYLSPNNVVFPGLTQSQIKEQYPDLKAQFCLKLVTPESFQATGNQALPAVAGLNTVYTDGNSLAVSGRSDPTAYIQQQISDAITAAVAITGGT